MTTNIPTPAILVDAREAARRLAISTRTLWTLTDDGTMPVVRIGRAVRYRVADLEAYAERMATKGGQQ